MASNDPTSGDYMATARAALSASIRELVSAHVFIERAGDTFLADEVMAVLDRTRLLRSRMDTSK